MNSSAIFSPARLRLLDFLLQTVVEHVAVGQAGQRVKVGLFPDQIFGFFPDGDVADESAEFVLARHLD